MARPSETELKLKIAMLNLKQRNNYKRDEFYSWLIISATVITCLVFAGIYG